jgi:isopentenyl-diphosphate delta-isomerase
LFCALDVTLDINPNEVSAAQYVSKQELETMFADSCKLLYASFLSAV